MLSGAFPGDKDLAQRRLVAAFAVPATAEENTPTYCTQPCTPAAGRRTSRPREVLLTMPRPAMLTCRRTAQCRIIDKGFRLLNTEFHGYTGQEGVCNVR